MRRTAVAANFAPNWFTAVMGTGIVANAAATLRPHVPGLHAAATAVWLVTSTLLVAFAALWGTQWRHHRAKARAALDHPLAVQFLGAPPMALLTVGAATLVYGPPLLGTRVSVAVDAALWTLGTLGGLAAAAAVPYLMFTRHELTATDTYGAWLMPVVPPMLSASTGALLLPHAPAAWQPHLLVADYLMLGASTLASAIITVLVWARLAYHRTGSAALTPTLWIVLGPVGTSVTAALGLAKTARTALPAYADGLRTAAVFYGLLTVGFALLWLAIAVAVTLQTRTAGMPFALTWWAFTFPVGVLTTGSNALATATGVGLLTTLGTGLYALLVGLWAMVAVRSLRGALCAVLHPSVARLAPDLLPCAD